MCLVIFHLLSSQDLNIRLRGEQRAAYHDLWLSRQEVADTGTGASGNGQLLALITKMKQLCNVHVPSGDSAKLEALKLILENHELPTDKTLLFSQYVETLEWLSGQFDGTAHRLFHGGMKIEETGGEHPLVSRISGTLCLNAVAKGRRRWAEPPRGLDGRHV